MKESKGHPHAELIAVAAEIAKTNLFWWEEFEFNNPAVEYMGWLPLSLGEVARFLPHLKYRLKTKTIKIGNKEIPVPLGVVYIELVLGNPIMCPIWLTTIYSLV